MNTRQPEWTLPSADVRAAWQRQVEAAAGDPALATMVNACQEELWPRFAGYYERLRVLPRRLRRALRRKLPVSLAGAALLLALGQGEALAATIVVDGTPCTLVDAITSANTNSATGGCAAGDDTDAGGDLIDLQTHVTLASYDNDYYGYTGLPVVTSKITITGNCTGAPDDRCTIERDSGATDDFRLLAVGTSGNLILDNVTLSGGVSDEGGGGVYNYEGATTIANSTVSGNSADYGGGGVYNYDGATTIANSTVSGNSANYGGGGVVSSYGATTITNSTVSGNSAYYGGGGVFNAFYGATTIANSTVSGNSADYGGGGVFNAFYGATTITNSTVSGNSTDFAGGGVYNAYYGTTTLAGALISGNSALYGAELNDQAGGVTAANHNLFGHSAITTYDAFALTFTPGASDIDATSDGGGTPTALTDILDTTLAANGGPTLTHALVSGSPAIDEVPLNGGGTGCETTDPAGDPLTADQRNFGRPAGAACDVGAFEFDAVAIISVPDCALLGNQSVSLGNGTTVRQGSAQAKVCSNEQITLGANVQVLDAGDVQQAYDSGASAGQVLFNNGVRVTGHVLANGDVLFGKNNRVGGDAQAGLDLNFRNSGNKVTGECRYGDSLINHGVFGNSCGSTAVEPTPPFAAAFALPTCTVTAPGGANIAPPANINYGLLTPGDYGHVRFGNGTTVELNGDYTFKSLAFGYNNRITLSGASILQVEQRLTLGNGTQQTLSGGATAEDIIYLVHSSMTVYSQNFGANTVLYGTICAPQATITLGTGTQLEGAVYADSIDVGYNVNITTSQAPLP